MRNKDEVIKEWWISYEYGDSERFLDFAEGLNINEFVKEDGERVVWLEDGNHYIAHGQRIGEFDDKGKMGLELFDNPFLTYIMRQNWQTVKRLADFGVDLHGKCITRLEYDLEEVTLPLIGRSSHLHGVYFTNQDFQAVWYHDTNMCAGVWHRISNANFWFLDAAQMGDELITPVYLGRLIWHIPIDWRKHDDSTLVHQDFKSVDQTFEMSAAGRLTVYKYQHWAAREMSGETLKSEGMTECRRTPRRRIAGGLSWARFGKKIRRAKGEIPMHGVF